MTETKLPVPVGQQKTMAMIWGIATFFVVNIALANTFFTGGFVFFPGLIAGALVWFYKYSSMKPDRVAMKEPPPQRYNLQKDTIVGILKETVPNINFEDRWWILHWFNKDRGEMKFRVNYDPAQKKGEKEKQQIVLDAYIRREDANSGSIVTLRYEYTQSSDEDRALDMIEHTTESIDYKLKAAEAGRL